MAPAIHTNTSGNDREGREGALHNLGPLDSHNLHQKRLPRAKKSPEGIKKGPQAGTRTAERSPVVTNKGAKVEAL